MRLRVCVHERYVKDVHRALKVISDVDAFLKLKIGNIGKIQGTKTSGLKVVIKELLFINYKSLFVTLIWSYIHWVSVRLHLLSFKMMTRSALLNLS